MNCVDIAYACSEAVIVPLRTKRWNDPKDPEDGWRVLICRMRPRGVSKAKEPWDEWWPDLGPSRELLAAFHGKGGAPPLDWATYSRRYTEEMAGRSFLIRAVAERLAANEPVTLLCSSACKDPAFCHRTLLARILERVIQGR